MSGRNLKPTEIAKLLQDARDILARMPNKYDLAGLVIDLNQTTKMNGNSWPGEKKAMALIRDGVQKGYLNRSQIVNYRRQA